MADDPKPPRKPAGFAKGSPLYKPPGGDGYGGPARGYSRGKITAERQPEPEAKSAGKAEAQTLREMIAPHRAEIVATWRAIATDSASPAAARIAAAAHMADRLEGKPAQYVEHLTSDGTPLVQIYLPDNGRDDAVTIT
jgi:hypothetical protein